ncbi:MAG: hypothetical protein NT051_05225 [Candidatus Micrarchaeota archaeon]|nr:hypothetical protein [Candidatus Micrarchaeota archaeon]
MVDTRYFAYAAAAIALTGALGSFAGGGLGIIAGILCFIGAVASIAIYRWWHQLQSTSTAMS